MSDQLDAFAPRPWSEASFGPPYMDGPAARLSDPAPSHEAARAALPTSRGHAMAITAALAGAGPTGLTARELADRLSLTVEQVDRRIAALRRAGHVRTWNAKDLPALLQRDGCCVHVAPQYVTTRSGKAA